MKIGFAKLIMRIKHQNGCFIRIARLLPDEVWEIEHESEEMQ